MKRVLLALMIVSSPGTFAQAADFAGEVMEATFKFYHPDSTSTCFLVKRDAPDEANYLVTAGHTLEKTKGETAVIVLRETKPDGSYDRHDHTIQVRHGDTPLWVRNQAHDVAVLRLAEPLPIPTKALSTAQLADEEKLKSAGVHLCSPLYVLTYPQRFEANGAGLPVARRGIFASPPLLPLPAYPTFLADFTTFAGDSGGPVFIDTGEGRPLVVGLTIAQNFIDVRVKTDYEEHLTRHPLGLGIVLHAQYVRETIEAAAKSTDNDEKNQAE
jgi:hypothetical protein